MLDRTKIMHALAQNLPTFSDAYSTDYAIARDLWKTIVHDPTLAQALTQENQTIPLPTWQESLSTTYPINPIQNYDVIAIDGSQIYPDRHEGISCFVINIGTVFFRYTTEKSSVHFESTPYLLSQTSVDQSAFENKQEIVNAMRTEREFEYGLELMCQQPTEAPRLLLIDGSLVFWHLQVTQTEAKQQFLNRYIRLLERYYEKKRLFAGFISLPQSRELINIARAVGQKQTENELEIGTLVDADLMKEWLPTNQRSIMFQNHARVTEQYPEHSKPHFYYLNTGNEIARVEIPAWIAHNKEYLSEVESIITDQCVKGFGYPIALAEAHEQAVVSAPDREFFYQMIQSMLNKNISRSSQKLMKKKKMPI